jgi:hypothetical protein
MNAMNGDWAVVLCPELEAATRGKSPSFELRRDWNARQVCEQIASRGLNVRRTFGGLSTISRCTHALARVINPKRSFLPPFLPTTIAPCIPRAVVAAVCCSRPGNRVYAHTFLPIIRLPLSQRQVRSHTSASSPTTTLSRECPLPLRRRRRRCQCPRSPRLLRDSDALARGGRVVLFSFSGFLYFASVASGSPYVGATDTP